MAKHNKKRNTAFVFESLVREVVKSVVSEDLERKNKIIKTLKTFFNKETELYKELQIYNSILETREMEKDIKEKVIKEARFQHSKLNKDKIFQSQTALINEINKNVTKDLFNNFVPNYKNLATIYNFLNLDVAPKKKVILENKLLASAWLPPITNPTAIPNKSHWYSTESPKGYQIFCLINLGNQSIPP